MTARALRTVTKNILELTDPYHNLSDKLQKNQWFFFHTSGLFVMSQIEQRSTVLVGNLKKEKNVFPRENIEKPHPTRVHKMTRKSY